jgi:hypothetical protein
MLINQRIIWSNNGTLVDCSIELNDLFSGTKTIDLTYNQDAIYIGSDLPFNHRYFKVSSANAVSSSVSVSIWDGDSWESAVDVLDQTAASGVSMAQSGVISWSTDRAKSWAKEETSENVTGITTLKIYDLYWVKLTWSASWTGSTALGYAGHKFGNDNLLGAIYPDLGRSAVKTAYTAGKTNWDEQQVIASEAIVNQLRKDRVLTSASQIFSWEMFQMAGIHKTAEIIYGSFGESKRAEMDLAAKSYKEEMNPGVIVNQDLDGDGHIDETERVGSVGWTRV